MKQTHLLVGEIVRPQGIRGEVKLRHFTDDPYRFEELDAVLRQTGEGFEPLTVEACRVQGDDVYLKLKGFDDRNAAETLRGAMLYVDREHAAELEENQFFIADLLGAEAVDTKGGEIGVLKDVLTRICESFGGNASMYRRLLASSFMLSADNAHAVHPNYTEKSCPTGRPYLNRGIVLKYSGNQKYTTDAVAAAMFRQICEEVDVPCQVFTNRSDIAGGSTLGNISGTQVALNCADIGLPQLAMHSPYETAGVQDLGYLIRAAKKFYECSVEETGFGEYCLKGCS